MKLTVNEKNQLRFAAVTLIIVIAFILIAKPESPSVDSSAAIKQHCANQNVQAALNGTYNPFEKSACVPFVSK